MKKISLIAVTFIVLIFIIVQKSREAPEETTEPIAKRVTTIAPSEPDTERMVLDAQRSLENIKRKEDFETTYRKLPSTASLGDENAPATATFLGHRFIQADSYISNDIAELRQTSELVRVLEDASSSEEELIDSIQSLLWNLKLRGNAGYFDTGPNVEMTNALLGYNYRKIAFIPADSVKINDAGELIDSWGNPYFFHLVSSKEVTVQSAGPDETLYTDDDVVSSNHRGHEYDRNQ